MAQVIPETSRNFPKRDAGIPELPEKPMASGKREGNREAGRAAEGCESAADSARAREGTAELQRATRAVIEDAPPEVAGPRPGQAVARIVIHRRVTIAERIATITAEAGASHVSWSRTPKLAPIDSALLVRHRRECEALSVGVLVGTLAKGLETQDWRGPWAEIVSASEPLQPAQAGGTSEPLSEPAYGAPGPFWGPAVRRHDLSRSLRLGDRTVQVSIASLRTEERRPVFITTWEPARPKRMSIEAVETVARFRAQAIDELGAEWRQLQESTT